MSSIIRVSGDRTICIVVGERLFEFLPALDVTSLRSELVAYSLGCRGVIIVKSTVPWETNILKQQRYWLNKYDT